MDLRLLEIFCRVYEERSFSGAAETLGLTQPTVSTHIKRLESDLGATLFDRLGRKTTATRAGELLYRHGREILDLKKATLQSFDRFLGRFEGDLELGASSIPGDYILPKMLEAFRHEYPDIHIRLTIADTSEIIESVTRGSLDLGFVGARPADSNLSFDRFAADKAILVAQSSTAWTAPRGGWTLASLRSRPMVIRERGSGIRYSLEQQLKQLGLRLSCFDVVAEVSSNTALREAVRRGLGFAYLSEYCVEHELLAGELQTIEVPGLGSVSRDLFIVRDLRRAISPLCEAFLMNQKLGERSDSDAGTSVAESGHSHSDTSSVRSRK